jgi:hypothetical protein
VAKDVEILVLRRRRAALLVGVPLALVVFVAGTLVTILADIAWAWVAGGAVAMIV